MADRVALFGGSFNPIHIGHLIVARAVAESLGLSRVIFIPCARPPHKWPHELASAGHRIEMTRRAIADEAGFEVSDVECRHDRLQYPIHTIETLRADLAVDVQLHWIVGADAVPELRHWHRLGEMMKLCQIVIARRVGYETPNLESLQGILSEAEVQRLRDSNVATPQVDVSATQIRRRVRERRSIRYWVPEAVCDYIEDMGLYLPTGSPAHEDGARR